MLGEREREGGIIERTRKDKEYRGDWTQREIEDESETLERVGTLRN